MEKIYNVNGLVVWNEEEIAFRNFLIDTIFRAVQSTLRHENAAWKFHQIESTTIIPRELVNSSYTDEDCFFLSSELSLRPETTAGSYEYAKVLFDSNKALPPVCVWQAGKSFRNEQDQVSKNMRLKEFYQLEFQCIFTESTKNDYHSIMMDKMAAIIKQLLRLDTRVVDSDRLPGYSLKTKDVEVFNGDKWMEVMSVSLRNDFTTEVFVGKGKQKILVLEVAVGLDRLVYNYFKDQT